MTSQPPFVPLAEMTGLTPLSDTTMCPDPQAVYRRLRDQWGIIAPVELEPGINAWLVMGHPEIMQITRDDRRYSRDPNNWRDFAEGRVPPDSGLGPMMFPRPNAYFSDGSLHRRLRAPLDEGLAGLGEHRIHRSVEAICIELIDVLADACRADLVTDYAAIIPTLAVASWFGLSTARGEELRQCLKALFGSGTDSQAGNRRFEQMLHETLTAAKTAPGNDLTSLFLRHPNLHNDQEVIQQMVLMISAGLETTKTWITRSLLLMITDPRFGFQVRGGRLDIDDALDEVLQRDPPMANMPARYAMVDCDLAGRHIGRGDALILGLAAANNDPRVHTDDPWLEHGNRGHLAWSTGPHTCPAHTPARIITRTAVRIAMTSLTDIRLTIPPEDVPLTPSPWVRCPATLPITFIPAHALTAPARI